MELFRGENTSTLYGDKINLTAVLLRDNTTCEINESKVGYIKGQNNATIRLQKGTNLDIIKLLDFSLLKTNNSIMNEVNIFDISTINSTSDLITQLSKTAMITANEAVTNNNLTSYITQNLYISGSTVIDTRTNIFLGRNQNILLINLSASEQHIDWVFGDNTTSVNILNSTLPIEGVFTSLVNSTDSNLSMKQNSIFGHTHLSMGDFVIESSDLIFLGNLTIKSGGNLTITNSNVSLKSNYNGELHIEVLNGGFWVNPGSIFRMMNSHLEGCGYSLPYSFSGLWVNASTEFEFINNTLVTDFYGIILENISGANIAGNRISGGKSGIFINNSNKIVIDSNTFLDFAELLQNSSAGIIINQSYNCTISNNLLNNIKGGNNGKAPSQHQGKTGGTGLGIILYNSFNNSFTDNILCNITGGLAESGGTKGTGGIGGLATGFYLFNSSYNNFSWNKIINITGGIGGTGGNNADGGIGGYGSGILIENSSFNTFAAIQITNVTGGKGGLAGLNGVDGPGGNALAVYIINSSENIIASFINDIYGGEGLLNGSIEYIYIQMEVSITAGLIKQYIRLVLHKIKQYILE
jgi:parallel beta-helix repeat protein